MKLLIVIAVINLLIYCIHCDSILDLSSYEVDEFKSELENYDAILVMYYAPYCAACKAMKPEFNKAAQTVKEDESPITVAQVDCTSGPGSEICSKMDVGSYPNLQMYVQGDFYKKYEGARDANNLVSWMRRHSKLYSRRFNSFTELNSYISEADEPLVMGIFANKDEPLYELWHKAAKKVKDHWTFRELIFAHIFDENAIGSSGDLKSIGMSDGKVLKPPSIVLHRPKWLKNKFEPTDIVYSVESHQDLSEWIFRKAFGLVLYRTRDNEEELKPPIVVAYYDVDFKRNPKNTHFWRNRMLKAAKENPDVKFSISNSHSFRKILRRQNLEGPKDNENPLVVAYDVHGTMFVMRDDFTMENFGQFIHDFKTGDVVPHLRSQDPPDDNDKRLIKIAVGGNFHQIVTNNPKDVFIDFYAPWCKHSKELAPTWSELAEQLKNEPDLDIVMMDAVANEVPNQFEIPQYPTVYLVPAKTKKPIKYTGGRYIHEFIQFLAKHTTNEMKDYTREGGLRESENVINDAKKVLNEPVEEIHAEADLKSEL